MKIIERVEAVERLSKHTDALAICADWRRQEARIEELEAECRRLMDNAGSLVLSCPCCGGDKRFGEKEIVAAIANGTGFPICGECKEAHDA